MTELAIQVICFMAGLVLGLAVNRIAAWMDAPREPEETPE